MNKTRFTSMLSGSALLSCTLLAAWAQAAPSAQAAPVAKSLSSSCADPRGVRLSVRSFFRVTNADDGFMDNDVEVYGVVNFNGRQVWRTARDNAFTARKVANVNAIQVTERTYDVIYNDSRTWRLIITGYLNDSDSGSKDDAMWNPSSMPRIVDIKRSIEQAGRGRRGIVILPGDNNSESAELVLQITRESDIY